MTIVRRVVALKLGWERLPKSISLHGDESGAVLVEPVPALALDTDAGWWLIDTGRAGRVHALHRRGRTAADPAPEGDRSERDLPLISGHDGTSGPRSPPSSADVPGGRRAPGASGPPVCDQTIYARTMQTHEPQSLESLIGTLSLEQVANVVEGLLRELGLLVREDRVHACLSPSRVLIGEGGEVTITDTGSDTPSGGTITGPGARRNDARYISPEQVLGRVVTTASDMYSVGCIVFELLAGRPPFVEESPITLLTRQSRDPVPDVREFAPDVPEPIARWVAKMTDKDPQARYQDTASAWEGFEGALARA